MAITCWYIGTAFIALLQACRIQHLSKYANDDLDILAHTVKQLQNMWASANVIAQGFDRLRQPTTALPTANPARPGSSATHLSPIASAHDHFSAIAQPPMSSRIDPGLTGNSPNILPDDCDFNWVRFFPFVSKSTNEIAENLVSGKEHGTATRGFPSPNNELFHDILLAQYQDLFDPFTGYTLNLLDITFNA